KRRNDKKEEKKSDRREDRLLMVKDYVADGADRAFLDTILHKIDYNYFLLNRFACLGGYSIYIQQQISKLDRSIDLMEQTFPFHESPRTTREVSSLMDASFSACGDAHYRYLYQYEHVETPGWHLYGAQGNEKIVFINTWIYSEDQPGAAQSCHL